MRDEDLREEFAAWLRPVRAAEPPALPVIRRRLRRRRTRPPVMTRTVTGKMLTLGYRCPNESKCAASYDIQGPRDMAVRASSANGEIQLSALAGPVQASSNLGLITASGLTSSTASFDSNLGEIDAVFTTAPTTVHATTDMGTINIRVPGTVSYDVNVTPGGLGSANVTVPQSSSSRHVIDATCGMGSVLIGPSS